MVDQHTCAHKFPNIDLSSVFSSARFASDAVANQLQERSSALSGSYVKSLCAVRRWTHGHICPNWLAAHHSFLQLSFSKRRRVGNIANKPRHTLYYAQADSFFFQIRVLQALRFFCVAGRRKSWTKEEVDSALSVVMRQGLLALQIGMVDQHIDTHKFPNSQRATPSAPSPPPPICSYRKTSSTLVSRNWTISHRHKLS